MFTARGRLANPPADCKPARTLPGRLARYQRVITRLHSASFLPGQSDGTALKNRRGLLSGCSLSLLANRPSGSMPRGAVALSSTALTYPLTAVPCKKEPSFAIGRGLRLQSSAETETGEPGEEMAKPGVAAATLSSKHRVDSVCVAILLWVAIVRACRGPVAARMCTRLLTRQVAVGTLPVGLPDRDRVSQVRHRWQRHAGTVPACCVFC